MFLVPEKREVGGQKAVVRSEATKSQKPERRKLNEIIEGNLENLRQFFLVIKMRQKKTKKII